MKTRWLTVFAFFVSTALLVSFSLLVSGSAAKELQLIDPIPPSRAKWESPPDLLRSQSTTSRVAQYFHSDGSEIDPNPFIDDTAIPAFVASVTLNPPSGPPGTLVTATGSGWPYPGDQIDICCIVQPPLVPVDANGNFSFSFTVPDINPGDYPLSFDSTIDTGFAVDLRFIVTALSGTWNTTTPLPQAFGQTPAVVYNGRVYLAGGQGPSGIRTTVYYATFQADGSLSGWNTTTPLPQARTYHAMARVSNYLYVIGGSNASGATQNTVYYAPINSDGSLGSWNTTTSLPASLNGPTAIGSGGRVYVLGGYNGTSNQNTVYYATVNANGSLGSWNTTTVLPQNLSFNDAIATNGRIYIAGGWLGSGSVWTAATYSAAINTDGTLGSWTTLSVLPKAIGNHVLLASGGNLYVAGGWDGSSSQSKVYYAPLQADGALSSWKATTDLPQTLHDHAGAVSGSRLYILGGFNHTVGSYQSTIYVMTTSSISGKVTDANNTPISGVSLATSAGHTVTTDGNGNYTLNGLAAGSYTITPSKSGYTFSPPSSSVIVPPDKMGVNFTGTPSNCTTSSSTWQNRSISPQTGTFTASFDATPSQAIIGGVTGLSLGPAADYPNLAVSVRFNQQGFIDAVNGSTSQAVTQVPYTAGVIYHFRLVIHVPNHTYDIFVTPANGTEKVIGTNFAFFTGQGGVTSLNNWALRANPNAGTGIHTVCNFTTSSAPPTYSVSGRVTDTNNNSLSGVTLSDNAGHTTTTDGSGNYTFSGLMAGNYTITPAKSGYTFSPTSRSISVPPNAMGQDFIGTFQVPASLCGQAVFATAVSGGFFLPVFVPSDGTPVARWNPPSFTPGAYYRIMNPQINPLSPPFQSQEYGPVQYIIVSWSSYQQVGGPSDCNQTSTKLPIVFVHGWRGFPPKLIGCTEADKTSRTNDDIANEYFQQTDNALLGEGYKIFYAHLISSQCYTPPITENVPYLIEAIDQAKQATGQDHVILVAHSMGGLISRAYIESGSYRGDVKMLFTFGSPHLGVPDEWQTIISLFNNMTLGKFCDTQRVACDNFLESKMISFNNTYKKREGVDYHVISGNAPLVTIQPFWSRTPEGLAMGAIIPGPDDGIVPTNSGTGLVGTLDRATTDEVHTLYFGSRTYFIRDGNQSNSYTQCLKKVLIDNGAVCGGVSTQQVMAQNSPDLSQHTSFAHGTLLAGQTVARTISLEGGPTLFVAQWQTGTLAVTLVDPNGQVINPAYAGSHPSIVTYNADTTMATYYFPNAVAGQWQLKLQGTSVPSGGSAYMTFAAFDSNLTLIGDTDSDQYAPGATATIVATVSGSPASATVTATVLDSNGTAQTLSLSSTGGGNYQAAYSVPNVLGYAEIRLAATGTTASGAPFERGRSLIFEISSNKIYLPIIVK